MLETSPVPSFRAVKEERKEREREREREREGKRVSKEVEVRRREDETVGSPAEYKTLGDEDILEGGAVEEGKKRKMTGRKEGRKGEGDILLLDAPPALEF